MVDLLTAVGIAALLSVIPTIVGALPLAIRRKRLDTSRWIFASLSLGIFMNFFFDFISGASALGVSLGVRISATQVFLVLSFAIGAIGIAVLKVRLTSSGERKDILPLAYLVAVALSFHSLGEGMLIGSDLRTTGLTTDVGTVAQASSFFLHKLAEGFAISVFFTLGIRLRDLGATTLLSSFLSVVGAPLGLLGFVGELTIYLFAVSAGATIFLLTRYIPIAFSARRDPEAMLLAVVGFLAIYSAALIHNTQI